MDYQSGWTVLSLMFTFKQQSFLVGPSLAIVLITVRMAAAVCSASTIGKKAVKKDNLHGGGLLYIKLRIQLYKMWATYNTSSVCSINLNET